MKEWKVKNNPNGSRLELHSIRRVLEPGETVIVAEPLPEEIKYKLGEHKITLQEVVPVAGKASSPKIEKHSTADEEASTQDTAPKERKKRTSDE